VLIGKYRVDNIVEANITWVSRDSKELFMKGALLGFRRNDSGQKLAASFFPPNPRYRDGVPRKENVWIAG
jgi:hypothetical protein